MKKIPYLILMIFLIPIVSAINISIEVPTSFSSGEQIYFNYQIISETNQEINFIPYVDCPMAPVVYLQEKKIGLDANKPYSEIYQGAILDYSIESQNCIAYVQINTPIQMRVEKNFTISTLPSFAFEFKTCKDSSCEEKSNIFLKNEKIYLDYDSHVKSPKITSTLISPSGKSNEIKVPSTLKLDEIGTYIINAQVSKEGYKIQEISKQIGVIEKEAGMVEENLSSASEPLKKQDSTLIGYLLIIGVICLMIITVTLILWNRHKDNPKNLVQ